MSEHDLFAPSSAPIWGHCSGAVMAQQAIPSPETEHTRNGTAAHWVASECLNAWRGMQKGSHNPLDYVGKTAPNGVLIEPEHAESADVYVTDVIETVSAIDGGKGMLLVEKRVSMPRVDPQNSGTLDAALVCKNLIYIWDFKHGHGVVEPKGNLQLCDYLEGLCEIFKINGIADQHIQVVARIVAPRVYDARGPVREWRCTLSDIRPYINQLIDKANEARTRPSLTTGEHCRYCTARGRCAALRRANYNLIDLVSQPIAFDSMSGADLALEYETLQNALSAVKGRLEALEDDLTYRVKNGDKSCGMALETSEGPAKWKVKPSAAISAIMLFGVNISREHCDTPTQARAKVPAKMRDQFDKMIAPLTKRNSGLKLVRSTETRAAKVFGKK